MHPIYPDILTNQWPMQPVDLRIARFVENVSAISLPSSGSSSPTFPSLAPTGSRSLRLDENSKTSQTNLGYVDDSVGPAWY